jgi:CDP-glycerol glycerophosphotransferase
MPRLTVVITAPDDGAPPDAAIRSVLEQALQDIEVLVVGAPGQPAADDARVRVVVPAEGEDPRNAGVAQADGEFLAFLDGSDAVTPHGYAALVAALESSGSDLVIGATCARDDNAASRNTARDGLFARTRPSTHVTELPALLEDRTAGNKVWRRAFWDRQALRWPDKPPYDDAPLIVRSYLAATALDVVAEPVLLQHRPPGPDTARSPRSEDMAAMADRLDGARAVSELLVAAGQMQLKQTWEASVVSGDLQWALSQLTEADDATQVRLVDTASALLIGAGPEAEASLRATQRLQFHLARRGLLPQLLDVVKAEKVGELRHTKAVRRGLSYYGDYPFRTDRGLRVPRDVYRLGKELNLRARVDDVWWEGDTLHIEGIAHIGLLDVSTSRSGRLWLSLVPRDSRRKALRLRVERVRRPDVTAASKESAYNYDWSGFRTSVSARALRGKSGWADEVWRLRATVLRGGVRRRRWVTATSPGRAWRPALLELPGGGRIVPTTASGSFAVEVDTMPAVVTGVTTDARDLVLSGVVRGVAHAPGAALLELDSRDAADDGRVDDAVSCPVVLTESPGGYDFEARVPASYVATGAVLPKLRLQGRKRTVTLRAAAALDVTRALTGDGDEVVASGTAHGRLQLVRRAVAAELRRVQWTSDGLSLAVDDGRGGTPELVLRTRGALREHVVATAGMADGFEARFAPDAMPTLAGRLPLTHGTWDVLVRRVPDDGRAEPLRVDDLLVRELPMQRTIGAKTFMLQAHDGYLQLRSGPDLRDDERGPVNQRRLQTVDFPVFLRQGIRDEVLFESYQSRAYADNARAVYEDLARRDSGLTCRWVVLDGQTVLPDGLEPIRRNSREHYEALARSRYVVVPNYRPLESWLTTPRDQLVVQTWHGAPFKKIGLDNERGERASSRDYLDALRRESARWDYLLSPNPPSTPILRGAFGYTGTMLETGYPRCDMFFRPDRDAIAARVREQLGLPEGKKVVLYAPTMRDDLRYGGNRFKLDLRLDLAKARDALAEDHVLLVRRHAKVVDNVASADGDFARDVSSWPDVNELLLATDVLITDYSSLMFDFANTGRPMLFFTYDLEDYRARLRGFYFDVERVPGPLLMTSDEVIAGVRNAAAIREDHRAAYDAFVADFCAWDDGHASARFVDQVFTSH